MTNDAKNCYENMSRCGWRFYLLNFFRLDRAHWAVLRLIDFRLLGC